jgi:hypothetical protein
MYMNITKSIPKYALALIVFTLLAAGCTTNDTNSTASENTDSQINSPIAEQNGIISYQGEEGKSALVLLKDKYSVQTKEFPGVGEFVENINGVSPNGNQFWAFYVNGVSSTEGASQYITKPTDKIEWRLEEIKQ